MTPRYLLDTNILFDLVRHPHGAVTTRIEAVDKERICTSLVVAAEFRYGAAKRGSARLSGQLDAVLPALDVSPLKPPVDHIYGELQATLERGGKMIGPYDLLIASQALALGYVLVTHNRREFDRVPGLTVENWLN